MINLQIESMGENTQINGIIDIFETGDINHAVEKVNYLLDKPNLSLTESEVYKLKTMRVNCLLKLGNLSSAKSYIDELLTVDFDLINKEYSGLNKINLKLLESLTLFLMGNLSESENIVDILISDIKEMKIHKPEILSDIDYIISNTKVNNLKGLILQRRRDLDTSLNFFLKSMDQINSAIDYGNGPQINQLQKLKASLSDDIARHYGTLHDPENSFSYLNRALEIRENLPDRFDIATSYHNIAMANQSFGKWKESEQYNLKALEIRSSLNLQKSIAQSSSNLGTIYVELGDLEKALQYFETAKEIDENLGLRIGLSISLNNIGNVFRLLGRLDESLEYLEKSLQIEKELEDKVGIVFELLAISKIYILKGDLEKAKWFLRENMELSSEIGSDGEKSESFLFMAKLNLLEGEVQLAYENILRAYTLRLNTKNPLAISEAIYHLIQIRVTHSKELKMQKFKKLEFYFDELKSLDEKSQIKLVKYHYLISEAFLYKNDRLDIIIDDEIADVDISITAVLLKCDLLLKKLKKVGKEDQVHLKSDLERYLNKSLELAEVTKSYPISVRVYLLFARFSLAYREFEQAKAYLLTAKNLAEEKSFPKLREVVEYEIERYLDHYYNSEVGDDEMPLDQRIEILDLEEYIVAILNESLEFITGSKERHRYKVSEGVEVSLCGLNDDLSEDLEIKAMCRTCRLIGLEETLKKIVVGHLLYWKCNSCYQGMSVVDVNQILGEFLNLKQSEKPAYSEFLEMSSQYLEGELSWNCEEIGCANRMENKLNLTKISELFQ